VIVAKETSKIKAAAQDRRFTVLQGGWEYGEFTYQPQHWRHP
jgi:hypothetical protein